MDFVKDFCKVLEVVENGIKTFRSEVEKNGELFEVLLKRQAAEFKSKTAKPETPKTEKPKAETPKPEVDIKEDVIFGNELRDAINQAFKG